MVIIYYFIMIITYLFRMCCDRNCCFLCFQIAAQFPLDYLQLLCRQYQWKLTGNNHMHKRFQKTSKAVETFPEFAASGSNYQEE